MSYKIKNDVILTFESKTQPQNRKNVSKSPKADLKLLSQPKHYFERFLLKIIKFS